MKKLYHSFQERIWAFNNFPNGLTALLWFGMHLNVLVICSILLSSFFIQVVLGEFPCPLCMVQRISMMLCALGQVYILACLLHNRELHFKDFMLGNGMTLFAALAGMLMSTRQILLHIVPPDPGYGDPILGLHIYTWALLIFFAELIAVGLNLLLMPRTGISIPQGLEKWTKWLFILLAFVIFSFAVATFIEEGFHWVLPDDPTLNQLFIDLGLYPASTPTP